MSSDSRIITITDQALEKLVAIRANEPDAEDLALVLAITGAKGTEFTYAMHMTPLDQVDAGDLIEHHGDLAVAIPEGSVANLTGAQLAMSKSLVNPGLSIDNPNSPSPEILGTGTPADLSGPIPERVEQVIEQQINPAIAAHGGTAELVAVEESTAYVRLGGACQGCGLAGVTLTQGIETTILEMVPEILQVIDVTDHNQGDNPYYEQSKK